MICDDKSQKAATKKTTMVNAFFKNLTGVHIIKQAPQETDDLQEHPTCKNSKFFSIKFC